MKFSIFIGEKNLYILHGQVFVMCNVSLYSVMVVMGRLTILHDGTNHFHIQKCLGQVGGGCMG